MYHSLSNYDCPICGLHEKEIQFYGFSCCNHPICGVCAIKLQKFSNDVGNEYDYSKCVICKQDISKIILSSHISLYEDYNEQKLISDDISLKYNIVFESLKEKEFFHKTITISCPQCSELSGTTMEQLIDHLRSVHKKRYCELCMTFNKCLQYELEAFNNNDYHQHRTKKHPKCRFCDIRFYDDSHLIKHVKDEHFVCDICHRNEGCVAYNTQGELLKHYLKDHFVCEICRSSNTVNVFESEYNLKTHKVSVHAHSLVGEGLVNVNYGDRNNGRYGNRRKPRDINEDFFEESTTHEPHQELPTMDCEQDFPRLGAEASSDQQLGFPSLNTDENDARTAFTSADTDTGAKSAVSTNPNAESKKFNHQSNNFAISVKKFAGIGGGQLNTEDFPSLGSHGPQVTFRPPQNYSGNHNKSSKTPSAAAALGGDEDFPTLPTNRITTLSNGRGMTPSWNIAKALPGQTIRSQAPPPVPRQTNVNRDDCSDAPVVSMVAEHKPKVSLVSREDFQNHGPDNSKMSYQKIPGEQDFPSLASVTPRTQVVQGKWGGSGSSILMGNCKPMAKKPTRKAPPPVPVPTVQVRQEYSASSFEHVPKTPASLRGIDYIPSDAPAKPVVSMVDSNQFSAIKAARDQVDRGPISPEELSPKSTSCVGTNRFAAISDQCSATRPAISSELDFPSLVAPKVSSQPPVNVKQNARPKPQQPPVQSQQVPRQNGPVVSLMDVAMGLGNHVYKAFPDEDERNQIMCQRLFDSLDTPLATHLLQLSNQYRTRQIAVRDYLDIVQSDFADRLDAVSKILPQMCVLLPDIPLQRSLMTTMPKKWVRDLRECITCSQVLHKSDIAAHNRSAH